MKKHKLRQLTSRSIWFPLTLLAVFVLETVLGNTPLPQLLLILFAFVLVSAIAIFSSMLFSQDILELTYKVEHLRGGIEELYKARTILVSNDALKDIERQAQKIRVVSPDLYDDRHIFYDTVLSNLRENKSYEYVIPNKPDLISRMDRLIEHLCQDIGISEKNKLPVKYVICNDYPIVTEYVIYDSPEFDGLLGFMEIKMGDQESESTNVALNEQGTYYLNRWFDRLFSATLMKSDAT